MMKISNMYYILNPSPWPAVMSLVLLSSAYMAVFMMTSKIYLIMTICMVLLIMVGSFQWWRDVARESSFLGEFSKKYTEILKVSMMLFIASEVALFMSFFWAYFHTTINTMCDTGTIEPEFWVESVDPYGVPLLNTLVLLSSGLSYTWSHHAIMEKDLKGTLISGILTVCLGIYFLGLQMFEYHESSFSIADSTYGSLFFMMTGFHGAHIMIGMIFILVIMNRIKQIHFNSVRPLGFDFSAWYWHFVDVVWLFLYVILYSNFS